MKKPRIRTKPKLLSDSGREFAATATEREAMLNLLGLQQQINDRLNTIGQETRQRLGLPASAQLQFDHQRSVFVLVQPAPPAARLAAPPPLGSAETDEKV